jgi:hypothetical protein
MVFKNFFFSRKSCSCVWLRLVGILVKVFIGREECVVIFDESHVCVCATFGFWLV